jgi:hypothetical protein
LNNLDHISSIVILITTMSNSEFLSVGYKNLNLAGFILAGCYDDMLFIGCGSYHLRVTVPITARVEVNDPRRSRVSKYINGQNTNIFLDPNIAFVEIHSIEYADLINYKNITTEIMLCCTRELQTRDLLEVSDKIQDLMQNVHEFEYITNACSTKHKPFNDLRDAWDSIKYGEDQSQSGPGHYIRYLRFRYRAIFNARTLQFERSFHPW